MEILQPQPEFVVEVAKTTLVVFPLSEKVLVAVEPVHEVGPSTTVAVHVAENHKRFWGKFWLDDVDPRDGVTIVLNFFTVFREIFCRFDAIYTIDLTKGQVNYLQRLRNFPLVANFILFLIIATKMKFKKICYKDKLNIK